MDVKTIEEYIRVIQGADEDQDHETAADLEARMMREFILSMHEDACTGPFEEGVILIALHLRASERQPRTYEEITIADRDY